MAAADLAISAGGATTWERCCLGLPSLVISIAENQRPTCEALAAAGVIDYLRHKDAVSVERLSRALKALLNDPRQRQRLAAASAELVDGLGIERFTRRLFDEARSI